MCGGDLEVSEKESVATCPYCDTKQTLPRLDDERRANLYDRANHARRNNEYDKAAGLYEAILHEDPTDAEAYWSLVLCKYGVEYVDDRRGKGRIPTCNRASFASVLTDSDYLSALEHADGSQKAIYEQEAQAIDAIQKGILEISSKEAPFDIFVCYKQTDETGARTRDSVLAHEMYSELTEAGFRVFFAEITLEDILGSEYEPYIFAALQSAKVMIVVGTSSENFNAVWVKNEWSRYLALIASGEKKRLIPAYQNMDPYDLPEAFSHLQAQDMSKLGFMQDLLRGVKKIMGDTQEAQRAVSNTSEASAGSGPGTESLYKRGTLFLEDKDFEQASEYFNKVLDIDPEYAPAYMGLLMAELKITQEDELASWLRPLTDFNNYNKALRFADVPLKERLEKCGAAAERNTQAFKEQQAKEAEELRIQQAKEAKTRQMREEQAAKERRIQEEQQAVRTRRRMIRERNEQLLVLAGWVLFVACAIFGIFKPYGLFRDLFDQRVFLPITAILPYQALGLLCYTAAIRKKPKSLLLIGIFGVLWWFVGGRYVWIYFFFPFGTLVLPIFILFAGYIIGRIVRAKRKN